MRRFQFSKNTLLQAREAVRQQRQAELALARTELKDREAALGAEQLRLLEMIAGGDSDAKVSDSINYLRQRNRYMDAIRNKVLVCEQEIAAAWEIVEQRNLAYQEAAIESRQLERVRDREEMEWDLDCRRSEQKELDEQNNNAQFSDARGSDRLTHTDNIHKSGYY